MSKSMNQLSTISEEDRRNIKEEITILERKLENALKHQAEDQATDLVEQLEERKARIAPVTKAPFEILSAIFEFCADLEWKAPLKIGRICRLWRFVILHTPRAWCYLNLKDYSDELGEAYIERSGQCGLHVILSQPTDVNVDLIAEVADRINCLTIPALAPEGLGHPCFSMLQHLRFPFELAWIVDLSTITLSSFPALRHLELHNSRYDALDCSSLPPLQTLILTAWDEEGWPALLLACKDTLQSLEIGIFGTSVMLEDCHINLRRLQYLKVLNRDTLEEYLWDMGFSTPSLQVYIEENEDESCSRVPGEHLQSVTHLRTQRPPSPESAWPHLRVLQLDLTFNELSNVLQDLERNPLSYPSLEFLEFGDSYMNSSEMERAERKLRGWNLLILPKLKGIPCISNRWSAQLPGEDETAVRGWPSVEVITETF